jgi:hypothetical protein
MAQARVKDRGPTHPSSPPKPNAVIPSPTCRAAKRARSSAMAGESPARSNPTIRPTSTSYCFPVSSRAITEGVLPSLHVDYKSSRLKQYHKEGRALRTETTIYNTRDFAIGKRLSNLPALRAVGYLPGPRPQHPVPRPGQLRSPACSWRDTDRAPAHHDGLSANGSRRCSPCAPPMRVRVMCRTGTDMNCNPRS